MPATTKPKVLVVFNDGEQVVFQDWMRAQKLAEREQGEVLSALFAGVTGFFGNDFSVLAAGGLNVSVSVGRGYRNASADETNPDEPIYKILHLESALAIVLNTADPSNGRIDRIVAKENTDDRNQEVRRFKDATTLNITNENLYKSRFRVSQIQYLPGTPSGSPVAPATPATWVSLATIVVAAADATIVQGDITDTRVKLVIDPTLVTVTGGTTDHGALLGLLDDDHPQYLLASGARNLTASMAVTAGVLIGTMPMDAHHGLGSTARHPLATVDPGGVAGFMSPADKAKIAEIGSVGVTVFQFKWLTAAKVQLAPRFGGKVFVDLDGATRSSNPGVNGGAIDIDITAHLEAGVEASNTWYYAYVSWDSGTALIVPHISVTAPSATTGAHPTNTTWRYVGSVRNDAGSNFREFDRHGVQVNYREALSNDLANNLQSTVFVDINCAAGVPRSTRSAILLTSSAVGAQIVDVFTREKGNAGAGRQRTTRDHALFFERVDANGFLQYKGGSNDGFDVGAYGYFEDLLA